MKLKSRFLLLLVCSVLAIPLMFITGDAGAASYKGDGAIANGSGGWALPPVTTEITCLECHGSGANHYQCGGFCPDPTNVRDKSSYLMTGHKNMLRKVSPGSPWAGADGTLYGTTDDFYGSGSIYDWIAGTVNVAGSGTIEPLFYIFGGWMDRGQLNTIFDGGFTGEQYPNGNYDCGRCHTTGYRFDATGPEPTTYNGTPITDAQFSRIPTDYAAGTSSWYLTSIQCERCHRDVTNEAGGHNCYIGGVYNPGYTTYAACTGASGTWTVVKPTLEDATALCIECHRQESADTVSQTITLSTDLAVSDGGSCSDGTSPDYATCLANSATWNYAPFFDANIGQAFLNSPHARFTGSLDQTAQNAPDLSVSMTGAYNSAFQDSSTGRNKGCDGCHDVHQSTVAAVNAPAPIKAECTDCHTRPLNAMNHPTGPYTPANGDLASAKACATCHMPDAYHLFRISVDANYSTFPTAAQYYAQGQTIGNTASDGKIAAVWSDLDLACGQCHGGSGAAKPGIPYFDLATLSGMAKNIHNTNPTASFTWTNDATASFKINLDASTSTCPAGATCTYNWDCGVVGVTAASGITSSCTYANTTPATVTLTVASGSNSSTASTQVTPVSRNTPPTAAKTGAAVAGYTYSFTDASTDAQDATSALSVTVTWGDGSTPTTQAGGTLFTHTYAATGTYIVMQKATDTGALSNTVNVSVPIRASSVNVTGAVTTSTGTAISNAYVYLKQGGVTKKITLTNSSGAYTFLGVAPGTYTVTAAKSGYTFSTSVPGTQPVTVGSVNVTAATIQSN